MLFQEMFLVNFKTDPGRPIQETIALTKEQYLSFIVAERSITLGESECQLHQEDAVILDDINAIDKIVSSVEDVNEEAYQKYIKKPKQLLPQEEHIICGYCGLKAKTLKRHLSAKHNVAPEAYLREFNLEPNMSLACLKLQREGKARMGKYWDSTKGKERKEKSADNLIPAAAQKTITRPRGESKSAKSAKETTSAQ